MINLKNNRIVASIRDILKMAVLLCLATVTGYIFSIIGFPETTIVLAYLLGVLLTARFSKGYIYGILASVLSIFVYNFFFTEPYYTFEVNDPSYFVTFAIMMITALLTSTLTSHVKKSATEAQEKESETKALYMLTNHLTDASNMQDIAGIATRIINTVFNCNAACLCFDENEMPEKTFVQQISPEKQISRETENVEEIKHKTEATQKGYYVDTEFYNWLIFGRDSILGIIRIPVDSAVVMTESKTRLLRAMIESTALAMDRFLSAQQRVKYQEETVQERYRGNLLRAISHDLRTPLSGIMGTSEMIIDMMLKKLKGVILMTNAKKFVLTGAIVLMIGALSVTAFAASTYKTPAEAAAGVIGKTVEEVITQRQDTGKTYGEIANEAGKLEEFKNEMTEIKKDALAQKVADGRLAQEQADEIIKAIEENAANCDGTGSAKTGQKYGAGFGMGNGNCTNGACDGNQTGKGRNADGRGAGSGMGKRAGNGDCINQ